MGPKDPDAFEPLGLYDVRVESRPQEVRLVLLDGLNVVSHRDQDRHLLPIVHLALKQLQDLMPVLLRLDEAREQRQELVVEADELVPDGGPATQLLLVGP